MGKSLKEVDKDLEKIEEKIEEKKKPSDKDLERLITIYLARNQISFLDLHDDTIRQIKTTTKILEWTIALAIFAIWKNELFSLATKISTSIFNYISEAFSGYALLPFEDQYSFRYSSIPTLVLGLLAIPTVVKFIKRLFKKKK